MFLAFILETCSGLFISSDSRYNVYITLCIVIIFETKGNCPDDPFHRICSQRRKNKIPSCRIYEGMHENNTR